MYHLEVISNGINTKVNFYPFRGMPLETSFDTGMFHPLLKGGVFTSDKINYSSPFSGGV
jgi:hypothetical protein